MEKSPSGPLPVGHGQSPDLGGMEGTEQSGYTQTHTLSLFIFLSLCLSLCVPPSITGPKGRSEHCHFSFSLFCTGEKNSQSQALTVLSCCDPGQAPPLIKTTPQEVTLDPFVDPPPPPQTPHTHLSRAVYMCECVCVCRGPFTVPG